MHKVTKSFGTPVKTVTEIGSALIMKQFHRIIGFQILQVGHACRSPRKLQMAYYIYIYVYTEISMFDQHPIC